MSRLVAAGVSAPQLQRATREGAIRRVQRGWYALPSAPVSVVRAVRAGGSLTGPSAARLLGLWVPPDSRLHVAVARNASGVASPAFRAADLCVHWAGSGRRSLEPVEPITRVLQHAVDCQAEEMAIVLMDSALNLGFAGLTLRRLRHEFAGLPLRYQRAVAKADPGAQSGIETLVRLRLRSRGIRVRTQVYRSAVGHVDFLVGDRLVIEVDGREHHDTVEGFATDRERDLMLFASDHRSLRLTYDHVMYRWGEIEPLILAMVRRRDHRWPQGKTRLRSLTEDQKLIARISAANRR